MQNWLVKKREIDTKLYILKRQRYEELVKKLSHGFHIVQTRGESTTLDFKKELDEATNILWLYGSDNVLKALNAYFTSSGKTEQFQNLIFAMRKDLIKTGLTSSEIEWFRAK